MFPHFIHKHIINILLSHWKTLKFPFPATFTHLAKSMPDKSYSGVMKKVLKNLESNAIIYLAHIGRGIAPVCL